MKRRVWIFGLLSLVLFSVGLGGSAWARFSFLVFSDSRDYLEGFRDALEFSLSLDDPPVSFLLGVGDIDPIEDTDGLIRQIYGIPWYPVMGNHEGVKDRAYVRDHIFPSLPNIVRVGPTGTDGTIYSFDYENAHFVVLDCYFDGWDGNIHNDPDIDDPTRDQYDWLKADLQSTTKHFIFVAVHEPAFPQHRHEGDSLNKYPEDRDAFWKLLSDNEVTALFVGHTHYYSRVFKDGVYQVDAGEARDSKKDLVYVVVDEDEVRFEAYEGGSGTHMELIDEWTVRGGNGSPRGDLNGDGKVNVADVQVLVNVILGLVPDDPRGDLDENGRIDVLDLQVLVNIVLSG